MMRSQLHLTARPGERDALLRELGRLEVYIALPGQPGFLGLTVLVDQDEPESVFVEGSCSSLEHFRRWWESRIQEALLRSLSPHLARTSKVAVT